MVFSQMQIMIISSRGSESKSELGSGKAMAANYTDILNETLLCLYK